MSELNKPITTWLSDQSATRISSSGPHFWLAFISVIVLLCAPQNCLRSMFHCMPQQFDQLVDCWNFWKENTFKRNRPISRGVHGVRTHPPRAKRSAWWDRKNFEWYKNNVMVVGLTISMHFQQFEDLKFLIFLGEHALKATQSVQLSQIRQDCPDSTWESRILTRLQSGHREYPDFEDQLSQANEQRNIFLLNYQYLSKDEQNV